MSNIHIAVSDADAAVTVPATLTGGMVGTAVTFTFSGTAWTDLTKVAVFKAGGVQREVARADWNGDACPIPWECLQAAGERLLVGVYGTDSAGTVILPTVYADCGWIQPGAALSGETAAEPTAPVYAGLMREVLAQAKASGQFDGPQGAPGAKGDKGDAGSPGMDGKSAYAAAQEGGYAGTEAAFNAALAAVESKAAKVKSKSAILRASGWDSSAKTVTARVAGVTAASHIIVTPAAASFEAWWQAGVRCTTQSADTLTFQCTTIPTANLTASVLILD